MKRLFNTRTYIALAALGVVTMLIAQAWAQTSSPKPKPTRPPVPSESQATHVLIIGDVVASKHGQKEFEAVLDKVSSGASTDLYTYDEQHQCKHHMGPKKHNVCIRTDNMITPGSADNQGEKVTFIQTRTTVQISSKSWSDISTVVSELQ
jgi:hypothetical protein